MAGHARYTALLDACVLYPIAIADSLLSLAGERLFAAKWSRRIEDEWIGALEADRPDLAGRLEARRESSRQAIPDWEVAEAHWSRLVPCLSLPDANDVHVLAAAIAGHADCIVTTNLRDFAGVTLAEYGIEVLHPDAFIIAQWDLDAIAALTAFRRMRARRQRPESSAEQFASDLERNGLALTAERLRTALTLI